MSGEREMKPAFTPGPWIIGRGADGYPIVHTQPDSFSPSGQGVAHICKRPMCQDHMANARLIAAAPTMYEALKGILLAGDEGKLAKLISEDAVRDVRAALAAAEGQP